MLNRAKTKVGVLRGGPSQEYDISLTTGKHILSLLKKEPLCEVKMVTCHR